MIALRTKVAVVAVLVAMAASHGTAGADPRIVNGYDASTKNFPWLVGLDMTTVTPNGKSKPALCGGALIAPTKVLTAGHCLFNGDGTPKKPSQISAIMGRDDLKASGSGIVANVDNVWVPDKFNLDPAENDIGVVTLKEPVTTITPVALATREDRELYAVGVAATVLGWGQTSDEHDSVSHGQLKGAAVTLFDSADCGLASGEARSLVCAGGPKDWKYICHGDSGGPLVVAGKLIGIVSTGPAAVSCRTYPGIYERVSVYYDFLLCQHLGGRVRPN